MMTDCAPAGALEGEKPVTIPCLMTDEARQFLVPRMRKAVGRSNGGRRRAGGGVKCSRGGQGKHQLRRVPRCGIEFALDCRRDLHTHGDRGYCSRSDLAWQLLFAPAQRLRRVEWQWGLELAASADAQVTRLAVARIDFRAVRSMARETVGGDASVRGTHVERLVAPVGVASRRRACLRRSFRSFLGVRIVARSTLPAVRIFRRVEIGKYFPHLMAAKTLRCARHQRLTGRVARRKRRHVGCELMAHRAVTNGLA